MWRRSQELWKNMITCKRTKVKHPHRNGIHTCGQKKLKGMEVYGSNMSFMEFKIMQELSSSKIPYLFKRDTDSVIKESEQPAYYTADNELHITFTTLSNPPETTQRPSGVNLIVLIPRVWPLYVWMHPFFLMSQTFRLVSSEPEAKNSPNGWNSTAVQLDLCPVRVRTTILQEQ